MDKVLLASELAYYNDLTVDIYYPPDHRFETKLPIVILSHGFQETDEFDKDMASQIDWAKLMAASGMIAISAQAGQAPTQNSYRVFDFLAANADFLGIDLTRIGFWAASGEGEPAFKALEDKELPYRDGFRAAVFLYLDLSSATPSNWPQSLSLFVVKAGADKGIDPSAMDNFVSQARSSNIPTEYIELAGAPHAFDVNMFSQDTRDVIQQALEFFKGKLLQ
jgi:dienelactone hydrolase